MAAKPEQLVNQIKSSINGNPLIHDAAHLVVDVKKTGFLFARKTEIHVTGRVETQREKDEIQKILDAHAGNYDVVNNLRAERR